MPAYLKTHSYGEYVFDWSWADAWQRMGLRYYPKLVTAVPFTPATGQRWGLVEDDANDPIALAACGKALCESLEISSWHLLFVDQENSEQLTDAGMPQRLTTQFHWFNQGYRDFQDFLIDSVAANEKTCGESAKTSPSRDCYYAPERSGDTA